MFKSVYSDRLIENKMAVCSANAYNFTINWAINLARPSDLVYIKDGHLGGGANVKGVSFSRKE